MHRVGPNEYGDTCASDKTCKNLGGVVANNSFSGCTVIHPNTETDCSSRATSDVQAGVAHWIHTGYVRVSNGARATLYLIVLTRTMGHFLFDFFFLTIKNYKALPA